MPAAPRTLPAGDRAVLVEFDAAPSSALFAHHLAAQPPAEVADLVAAERTILVVATPGTSRSALRDVLADRLHTRGRQNDLFELAGEEVTIGVHYDGADLDDVARITGLTPTQVIAAHTNTTWTCSFIGFAPGFGYLTSSESPFDLPRRAQSRPQVPAGAVALAGKYSAVYPRSSPGGWQLIGTTDTPLWNLEASPPSLLRAGIRVRFTDLDAR